MLEKFLSKYRARVILKRLPRGKSILDIGCGKGHFLKVCGFEKKVGIDKEHDIYKGLPDGKYDAISMLAVIEHLNPVKIPYILKDISEHLNPDGVFVFTTPAPWTNIILKILATLNLISKELYNEHKKLYSKRELTFLLGQFFKKIEIGYFELGMNIWGKAR